MVEWVEMSAEGIIPGDFLAHWNCLVNPRISSGSSLLIRRIRGVAFGRLPVEEEWRAHDVSDMHRTYEIYIPSFFLKKKSNAICTLQFSKLLMSERDSMDYCCHS